MKIYIAIIAASAFFVVGGTIVLFRQSENNLFSELFTMEKEAPTQLPPMTSVDDPQKQRQAAVELIEVKLLPLTEEAVSATVIFSQTPEKNIKAHLTLQGATSENQLVHIHQGTCKKPGQILHYLRSPIGGSSDTIIDAEFSQLKGEGPLVVNLHRLDEELENYYLCGSLDIP